MGVLLQRALGRQQLPVIGAATVRDPAPEPAGVAGQLGGARPEALHHLIDRLRAFQPHVAGARLPLARPVIGRCRAVVRAPRLIVPPRERRRQPRLGQGIDDLWGAIIPNEANPDSDHSGSNIVALEATGCDLAGLQGARRPATGGVLDLNDAYEFATPEERAAMEAQLATSELDAFFEMPFEVWIDGRRCRRRNAGCPRCSARRACPGCPAIDQPRGWLVPLTRPAPLRALRELRRARPQ